MRLQARAMRCVDDGDVALPEGGRRLDGTRHFQRLAPSYMLGIVVATAAVTLTESP